MSKKKKSNQKPKSNLKLTDNEERDAALKIMNAVAVRASIASQLGMQYGGDRDLYTALGYKSQPSFTDYIGKYYRQDIARAVIDAPVRASWKEPPTIVESEEYAYRRTRRAGQAYKPSEDTPFEARWIEIQDKCRLFNRMSRVDRLAGIGTYAVLLLGFDDTDSGDLSKPVEKASELLYATPYSMANADIKTYDTDSKSERYGLPLVYGVQMRSASATIAKEVHYSRLIHVAEDVLEDDSKGIPRLRAILNRLDDLEKIVGGSGEMFWRGAFPGLGFMKKEGTTVGAQDEDDMTDEIEEYIHGLKRYLKLEGIDIKEIAMQVADPSAHVSVQLDMIASATRIPKRILVGSERGELASSQDEKNWNDTIAARQREHCEAVIIRPTIDRLVSVGVMPETKEGYTVGWPDLSTPSDKEKAEVGEMIARAMKAYLEAAGAEQVLAIEMFLKKLGFTQSEIDKSKSIIETEMGEIKNEPIPEVEPDE